MRIQEIKGSNFAPFKDMPLALKAKQIGAVMYIDRLASVTSTQIDAWDINKIFGQDGHSEIVVEDVSEINKRFFQAKKEESQSVTPLIQTPISISPDIKSRMIKNLSERNRVRKGEIDDQFRSLESNVALHHTRILECVKSMSRLNQELDSLNTSSDIENFTSEVEKVIQSSFFELWDLTPLHIEFATRGDLVLEQVIKAAGIDHKVNLGRMLVRFSFANLDFKVIPLHRNVLNSRQFHPHVFSDNRICYGTAEDKIYSLVARLKLSEAMEIIASVLSNYNPDSPITPLGSFVGASSFNLNEPISPIKLRAEGKLVAVKVFRCVECSLMEEDCQCDEQDIQEDEEWMTPEEAVIYE